MSNALFFVTKRAPLEVGSDKREVLLTPSNNFSPLALSVDWLNNHLYILVQVQDAVSGENVYGFFPIGPRQFTGLLFQYQKQWQISRCDLNGSRLTVAIAGLRKQPSHIEVDPYNG